MINSIQQFLYVYGRVIGPALMLATAISLVVFVGFATAKWPRARNTALGVFGCSVIALSLAALVAPGNDFPEHNLPQETIKVAKVSHVSGTDNYVVQDKNGKTYNLDKTQITAHTAAHHSTAKLVRCVKPEAGTKQRKLYDAAKKYNDLPEPKLTMRLTAEDYNKHATVWNFN